MTQQNNQNTKKEILQCATRLFLEKGYTNTYVTTIANELHISTGNLTFHYPTKEHILAELVRWLFAFQWEEEEKDQNKLSAYLFELVLIASVCEENPKIKDLLLAVYTHPMPLTIIRRFDTERAKLTFGAYCSGWTDTDYILAENVASGIEFAMFMPENAENISFEQRVASALGAIMKLYEVPEEERERLLSEVMETDYRSKGSRVFEEFCGFVGEKMKETYGSIENTKGV